MRPFWRSFGTFWGGGWPDAAPSGSAWRGPRPSPPPRRRDRSRRAHGGPSPLPAIWDGQGQAGGRPDWRAPRRALPHLHCSHPPLRPCARKCDVRARPRPSEGRKTNAEFPADATPPCAVARRALGGGAPFCTHVPTGACVCVCVCVFPNPVPPYFWKTRKRRRRRGPHPAPSAAGRARAPPFEPSFEPFAEPSAAAAAAAAAQLRPLRESARKRVCITPPPPHFPPFAGGNYPQQTAACQQQHCASSPHPRRALRATPPPPRSVFKPAPPNPRGVFSVKVVRGRSSERDGRVREGERRAKRVLHRRCGGQVGVKGAWGLAVLQMTRGGGRVGLSAREDCRWVRPGKVRGPLWGPAPKRAGRAGSGQVARTPGVRPGAAPRESGSPGLKAGDGRSPVRARSSPGAVQAQSDAVRSQSGRMSYCSHAERGRLDRLASGPPPQQWLAGGGRGSDTGREGAGRRWPQSAARRPAQCLTAPRAIFNGAPRNV
jgi:hypothetical protein